MGLLKLKNNLVHTGLILVHTGLILVHTGLILVHTGRISSYNLLIFNRLQAE